MQLVPKYPRPYRHETHRLFKTLAVSLFILILLILATR